MDLTEELPPTFKTLQSRIFISVFEESELGVCDCKRVETTLFVHGTTSIEAMDLVAGLGICVNIGPGALFVPNTLFSALQFPWKYSTCQQ